MDGVLGIENWLRETKSSALWIEGPASVPYPSGVSTTALYVSDLVIAAEIPCISFFPKTWYPTNSSSTGHNIARDGTSVPQQRVLLNLIYSLVRQLIGILPRVFNTTPDVVLDEQRLDKLDGTVKSIEPAMTLIRDLLPLAPQNPLVFMIDRLPLAESVQPETRTTLKELVLLLQEQQARGVIKLLFTTDGRSQVLSRTIGFRDTLDLSSSMLGRRPGKPPRETSSLSSLSWASGQSGRPPV